MLGKVAIVLACCAVLSFGFPSKSSARCLPFSSDASSGRLRGGEVAGKGEFPWHVSIQYLMEDGHWKHWCDGSVISNEFLLTGWICQHYTINMGYEARVVAGTLNWTNPGSIHTITERFDSGSTWLDTLAVWRVDPPFEFGPDVAPVRLPAPNAQSPAGTVMTVSAWGEVAPWEPSDVLMKLDSPVVQRQTCNSIISFDPEYRFCAGSWDSEETLCSNPGFGSPLVYDGELRGVFWNARHPNEPAIYTEVALLRRWISQVTGL